MMGSGVRVPASALPRGGDYDRLMPFPWVSDGQESEAIVVLLGWGVVAVGAAWLWRRKAWYWGAAAGIIAAAVWMPAAVWLGERAASRYDARILAVDARTGRRLWSRTMDRV